MNSRTIERLAASSSGILSVVFFSGNRIGARHGLECDVDGGNHDESRAALLDVPYVLAHGRRRRVAAARLLLLPSRSPSRRALLMALALPLAAVSWIAFARFPTCD